MKSILTLLFLLSALIFVFTSSPLSSQKPFLGKKFASEEVFTLTLLLSNANITQNVLSNLTIDVHQQLSLENRNISIQNASSIRLQLNPVYSDGAGLSEIVQNVFCSPASRGLNSIMLMTDVVNGNGISSHLAKLVASIADYNSIPTLAWSSQFAQLQELDIGNRVRMIGMTPYVQDQARAMFAFTKKFFRGTQIALIISKSVAGYKLFYDELSQLAANDEGHRRYSMYGFDSHQHHRSSRFSKLLVVNGDYERDLHLYLVGLTSDQNIHGVIVYGDWQTADRVMEEAHSQGLTTGYLTWMLAHPGYRDTVPLSYPPGLVVFSYDISKKAQISAVKAGIRVWSEALHKFIQLSKASYDQIKPVVSCTRFKAPEWKLGNIFRKVLADRFERLTKLSRSHNYAELNTVTLYSVEQGLTWKKMGHWSVNTGLFVDTGNRWWYNFELHSVSYYSPKLRVVTLDEPPYIFYQMPKPDGTCLKNMAPCKLAKSHVIYNRTEVCCEGLVVDLLLKLSNDIGFTYDLFEVPDQKWGSLDKVTDKWNGLVEAILNGSSDMVATSLKINTDRSTAIDFTIPFYQTGITILVKVYEGSVSPLAFLRPFSLSTWFIVFFGCVTSVSFFIFFFENFAKIFASKDELYFSGREETNPSLFGSFWLVLSMLFNAAIKRDIPRSLSGRFVVNIWALFCVIFMSSFMANLAAFMITKEEWINFIGLDDVRLHNPFTRNPPWRFSTIPFGATEHIIKSNFPDMYQHMRQYLLEDVDKGVEAVVNGEIDAFLYDASVLDYKAGRDKNCKLRTVGKWYAPTGYGFGFPKSSHWLHPINRRLLLYKKNGFMNHLEDFWLSSFCKERLSRDSQTSSELGVMNLRSVFVLLLISLAICTILLGLELLCATFFGDQLQGNQTCRLLSVIGNLDAKVGRLKKLAPASSRNRSMEFRCPNANCQRRRRVLLHLLERTRERIRLDEHRQTHITKRQALGRCKSESSHVGRLQNYLDVNINTHHRYSSHGNLDKMVTRPSSRSSSCCMIQRLEETDFASLPLIDTSSVNNNE